MLFVRKRLFLFPIEYGKKLWNLMSRSIGILEEFNANLKIERSNFPGLRIGKKEAREIRFQLSWLLLKVVSSSVQFCKSFKLCPHYYPYLKPRQAVAASANAECVTR